MADQDGRAGDAAQRASDRGNVAFEGVEAVLGGYHRVALRLAGGDHLAEARTVGPQSVGKDDARLGRHRHMLHSFAAWPAADCASARAVLSVIATPRPATHGVRFRVVCWNLL